MKIDQELESNIAKISILSRLDSENFREKSLKQISKSEKEKFLFLTGEEFSEYRRRLIADGRMGYKSKDSKRQEERPPNSKIEENLRELHMFLKAEASLKKKPIKRTSSIARLPLSN